MKKNSSGWKGESRRHSLARKGIKTMKNGETYKDAIIRYESHGNIKGTSLHCGADMNNDRYYPEPNTIQDYAEDIASRLYMHMNEEAGKLYIEFIKNFGKNNHERLINELQEMGVSDYLIGNLMKTQAKLKKSSGKKYLKPSEITHDQMHFLTPMKNINLKDGRYLWDGKKVYRFRTVIGDRAKQVKASKEKAVKKGDEIWIAYNTNMLYKDVDAKKVFHVRNGKAIDVMQFR